MVKFFVGLALEHKRCATRLSSLLIFVFFSIGSAGAIDIKAVKSPGGITAWLVESNSIPLISMDFAFAGGAAHDPPGKEGTANLLAGLMDEGADDLDGPAFRALRDRLSIRLSFDVTADNFYGNLSTLSKNKYQAFSLLKKAITRPRLDDEPIERMRQYNLQQIEQIAKDPGSLAYAEWMRLAFPKHPYGRPIIGTAESLAQISVGDLRSLHKNVFNRKGLIVSVVGDIDAESLAKMLDDIFGEFPDNSVLNPPPLTEVMALGVTKVIEFETPQSTIVFGGPGVLDSDPGDYPAYLMGEILGGEASFSKLNEEVRERRGLTYGIGFASSSFAKAGYTLGYFSTANSTAGEALRIVKSVLKQMAANGPTAEELALAKTYLTGSYALRFNGNGSISRALLGMQLQGFPIDHVKTRNSRINAVTLEQVREQAKRLLDPKKLIVTIAGKPQGLER